MEPSKIKKVAKEVIRIEANSVSQIVERIDDKFESAVQAIMECDGRLIIMGMGKSGLISQKIASTMASTGTPSHFVSPAEATHGDLGMIKKGDVLLIVSNSGETMELIQLLPSIKRKGVLIIGLIGKKNSSLAREADISLDTSVEKEACTLDLAPTASTTATLAMGDALAVSLLEVRGFNKTDFAELHPGGMLGKRLLLTIDNLTHKGEAIPFISINSSIKDALFNISEKGLGLTGVMDEENSLIGIITDGDIRRGLEKFGDDILNKTAEFLMSEDPKWISSDTLAISALELMEKHSITSLFVYSDSSLKRPDGIVHIHDILKSGIQ
jgi:arabinose-5-phosphate isomerase|tara:strand:- start:748 stop:1728 length:981 start_codon:yes stop_codon:yes gene_type:complete